jgi:LysR family transcriptional activator of nhaA
MDKLNYGHLYYFYVIARVGSVTRASVELKLSQPTLSTQLNQFEDSLGVLLFERKNRTLFLTEMGKRVFDYASEIFRLGAELSDVIHDRRVEAQVKVQIGVLGAVPRTITRALVERALLEPGAHVTIVEGSFPQLMKDLKEHKLDLVLANVQDRSSAEPVSFHQLVADIPVVFFGHKKWGEFANRFPASAARIPIILPTKGNWLRSEIDQYFAAHSVQPQIIAEIQDPELQRQLALSGAGATALAQLSIESELKSGELIQFDAKPFCYERIWLVSAYRRHENPVASALMKNFKLESTSRIEAP